MKNFLIVAPSYDENSGGCIVLHKLCDQINRSGGDSYLLPYVEGFEFSKINFFSPVWKVIKIKIKREKVFKTNSEFETPILKKIPNKIDLRSWIVVYPEIVFGNPVKAQNVVRWFLHKPGHFTGKICFGRGELYYKFHAGIESFLHSISRMSNNELKVVHYPVEFYNESRVSSERAGTAYCLRKGAGKKMAHDLSDSILIDGKSHEEIAAIFKRVKQFVSYDPYTAYSTFAVLCGCDSIVIPDTGVSEEQWMPNPRDRDGIAYGFDNLQRSKDQRHLLLERVRFDQEKTSENTKIFMEESQSFFAEPNIKSN